MAVKCANCGKAGHTADDCDMAEKLDDNSGGDKEARKAAEDNSGGDKEARKGKKKTSGSDAEEEGEDPKEEEGESADEEEAEEEEEDQKKGLGGGSTGKKPASKAAKPTDDDGDEDDMSKGGSEGDDPSNYAYVPDPEKPSTWKLKIHDAAHVGGAAAALGPGGFRGQKADIPAAALPKVKAKVRAAWKKHNPDKDSSEMPEVLKSNTTLEQLTANASALSKRFAGAIQGGK